MAHQPLSGQMRAGEPLITHDPASVEDLQVVEIIDTRKADYDVLAYGTKYPGYVDPGSGQTLYDDFVLIEVQAVDQEFSRRIWQKLPGSWLTSQRPDPETGDIWTTRSRKNVSSRVTPQSVISPGDDPGTWGALTSYIAGDVRRPVAGNLTVRMVCTTSGTSGAAEPSWNLSVGGLTLADGGCSWLTIPNIRLSVTSREDINTFVCKEEVTEIPPPHAGSKATAIKESETISYQFPARPDLALYEGGFYDAVAFSAPEARQIRSNTYLFWMISDTKPAQMCEDIIFSKFIGVQGNQYTIHENSLTDGQTTVAWSSRGPLVTSIPASTPNLTDYLAGWVGQEKIIHEEIKATKFAKLWRCYLTGITMR